MKFTLEDYQDKAVERVLAALTKARRGYEEDGEKTAVGLTAPTGAGKTVIATAVLEGIYQGTPSRDPDPLATVLWLTDDRSLNAQTIGKILQASGGRIDANRIRFLWDLDERVLEPGFIYFVHIQALQKNSTLHAHRPDGTKNDKRTYGAWDMIANTVQDRGEDFIVIWDEAHRGSGTTKTDRKSIAGTIVNGGPTNIGTQQPAAPVVLGISATPDRFYSAMKAADRTMRLVEVPPGDVRESGLLKDRILLRNIAEDQSADNTMLALAVEDLKDAGKAWRAHHQNTGDRLVEPLLVVQVPPKVTEKRLTEILDVIATAWSELTGHAVAHAFGDPHGPLTVGDRTVRYLPPQAISGDDRARVVLFKSALTTGWDCPRAEVLVSFQGKDSYTEIAQLIGRLVRTPLAQRVDGGDDRLNEVVAYLPGFRTEHVVRVVNALTEDETVQTEVLISPEMCSRSTKVPGEVFELLDTLPSYMRPRVSYPSRTAQLMRLAAALNEYGPAPGERFVANAPTKAKAWIVDQMRAADGQRKDEIDKKVDDILALKVGTTVVGYGEAIMLSGDTQEFATSERDLDGYYNKAVRLLPDGAAAWYYNDLCNRDYEEVDAGVRVAAMAGLGFKDVIEEAAASLIRTWRDQHRSAVSRLQRWVRDLIEPLWHLGSSPMHPTTVEAREVYPASTQKVKGDQTERIPTYPHHLYVIPEGRKGTGEFPVDTSRSSWERKVLEAELNASTLLGWYRNPPSGRHALAISYEFGDQHLLMHPDFLFWHNDGDGIVMDIVDPHQHNQADTGPKWSALAKYAQDHPDRVRRCLAIIEVGGRIRALDLTAPGVAERVAAATNQSLIEALYDAEGMDY
ncbi:DEAD/DEAH box helicase [Nocardioides limicola]|uniref:DEAD/DEAH box helicase n=1 Tax=Nocardioides limicola TaxID=2803368 RepID=UPI00193BDB58|nr:DEAD/DEAH box helicase family protein [Nocardioides sp. DJM-14]